MKLSNVLYDPAFRELATLLAFANRAPRFPPRTDWQNLTDEYAAGIITEDEVNKLQVIERFVAIQLAASEAGFSIAPEIVQWITKALDDGAIWKLALAIACASAPDVLLTPAQAAKRFGLTERAWRKRASSLPGAFQAGGRWLIPIWSIKESSSQSSSQK